MPILDLGFDGSWRGEDTCGIEEDGMGTGFGRLLELFSSGEGETDVDEGTEWVLFLESKGWVGRVTGFDIELPFASREPSVPPNELDLSIDELAVSFNGFGPLDTDCVRGCRSITPNSDVLGILLNDGVALNVEEGGVDGN